jgi:hypothetical protein
VPESGPSRNVPFDDPYYTDAPLPRTLASLYAAGETVRIIYEMYNAVKATIEGLGVQKYFAAAEP